MYTYTYTYMYTYTCMYIHINIYIYKQHIYIYIYIYIFLGVPQKSRDDCLAQGLVRGLGPRLRHDEDSERKSRRVKRPPLGGGEIFVTINLDGGTITPLIRNDVWFDLAKSRRVPAAVFLLTLPGISIENSRVIPSFTYR